MPFCGLAIVETLAAERTKVVDPFLKAIQNSQPNARFEAFQRDIIDEMALVFKE